MKKIIAAFLAVALIGSMNPARVSADEIDIAAEQWAYEQFMREQAENNKNNSTDSTPDSNTASSNDEKNNESTEYNPLNDPNVDPLIAQQWAYEQFMKEQENQKNSTATNTETANTTTENTTNNADTPNTSTDNTTDSNTSSSNEEKSTDTTEYNPLNDPNIDPLIAQQWAYEQFMKEQENQKNSTDNNTSNADTTNTTTDTTSANTDVANTTTDTSSDNDITEQQQAFEQWTKDQQNKENQPEKPAQETYPESTIIPNNNDEKPTSDSSSKTQVTKKDIKATTITFEKTKKHTKYISLKWSVKGTDLDGYQIRISKDNKTFKIKSTIKKGSTFTFRYSSGASGKTYYFQVRGYKIINGKKIYTPWSKAFKRVFPTKKSVKK